MLAAQPQPCVFNITELKLIHPCGLSAMKISNYHSNLSHTGGLQISVTASWRHVHRVKEFFKWLSRLTFHQIRETIAPNHAPPCITTCHSQHEPRSTMGSVSETLLSTCDKQPSCPLGEKIHLQAFSLGLVSIPTSTWGLRPAKIH